MFIDRFLFPRTQHVEICVQAKGEVGVELHYLVAGNFLKGKQNNDEIEKKSENNFSKADTRSPGRKNIYFPIYYLVHFKREKNFKNVYLVRVKWKIQFISLKI